MKTPWMLSALIAACLLGGMTQDAEGPMTSGIASASTSTIEIPVPEAMQDMMQSMTPGEPHKKLAAQSGEFIIKGRTWWDPKAQPMELKGTATQKMIHGGRYQLQEFKGDTMGMPYEGTAVTGYDNVTKEYFSTWIDTMRTGIVHYRGKADEKGVVSMTCEMEDPRDPTVKGTFRRVMKLDDKDSFTIETWTKDKKHPEEFKVAEMTFTRKK